jgi:hypothetical protein
LLLDRAVARLQTRANGTQARFARTRTSYANFVRYSQK